MCFISLYVYECIILLTVREEGSNEPEARVLLERSCRGNRREREERERPITFSFFFSFYYFLFFFFPSRHCNKEANNSHSDRESMITWVHLFSSSLLKSGILIATINLIIRYSTHSIYGLIKQKFKENVNSYIIYFLYQQSMIS